MTQSPQKEEGWKHVEISRNRIGDVIVKVEGEIHEEDMFRIPVDSKTVGNFQPVVTTWAVGRCCPVCKTSIRTNGVFLWCSDGCKENGKKSVSNGTIFQNDYMR